MREACASGMAPAGSAWRHRAASVLVKEGVTANWQVRSPPELHSHRSPRARGRTLSRLAQRGVQRRPSRAWFSKATPAAAREPGMLPQAAGSPSASAQRRPRLFVLPLGSSLFCPGERHRLRRLPHGHRRSIGRCRFGPGRAEGRAPNGRWEYPCVDWEVSGVDQGSGSGSEG